MAYRLDVDEALLTGLQRIAHDQAERALDALDWPSSTDDVAAFGGSEPVHSVSIVVDGQRVDLERRSVAVGRRLYAEKPKHLTRRLENCWTVWRDVRVEPDVGEIADLAT